MEAATVTERYGRITDNVRSILQNLSSAPHPGYALVLVWLMLRQDDYRRVKKTRRDRERLRILANLLDVGDRPDLALQMVLFSPKQLDRLARACAGMGEKDLVLCQVQRTRAHQEIIGEAIDVLAGMGTDAQERFYACDFAALMPD